MIEARSAIQVALKEAESKDEALLAAIRADLHSRPSRAELPTGDSGSDGSMPAR